MSHFAKVCDGKVLRVIVAEPEFFETFVDNAPGDWIQTSYNTRQGVHYGPDGQPDGGVALRGNYAGVGYIYDRENDVFYPPKPYPSWVLNIEIWNWQAPVLRPEGDAEYDWDETTTSWVLVS